jgi:hypothetical protein
MPRDGSNVYHRPPGTDAVSNTTIASAPYNVWIADVEQDLNLPRPIVAGGTGATSGPSAIVALSGEQAKQNVDNYDSFPFVSGSFSSAATATNPPVAGHTFSGIAVVNVSDATSMFVEARDYTDGRKYVRQKTAGVWGGWALDIIIPVPDHIASATPNMAAGFTGSSFVVNTKADLTGTNVLTVANTGDTTITSGTFRQNGGRIVSSLAGNASVVAYDTSVNTAAGIYVYVNGRLSFGLSDGGGTPTKELGWFDSTGSFAIIATGAYKPGGGVWTDSSDARIKQVTGDYTAGLKAVLAVTPRTYKYLGNDTPSAHGPSPHRQAASAGTEFVGFVAQEIEEAFPEMVRKKIGYIDGERVTDLRDIDTGPLIYALLNAVKELAAQVKELQGK